MNQLSIPDAPRSIQKGVPLTSVLDREAIEQLAKNLQFVHPEFRIDAFVNEALEGLAPLSITERSAHIARAMRNHLPEVYSEAIEIILKSLTPPLERTEDNGMAPMFYMPHGHFVANYGVLPEFNNGNDPFDISMKVQYELTQRFTSEFSIRSFLIADQDRTLNVLYEWMLDTNPHVRRLCSEGTRPRLPWAPKLPSFVKDPGPTLPILEELKNDVDLYVRRSVANHLGDIAKDHIDLALNTCERWLDGATKELKWVIRHALRNPAKKENPEALRIRKAAK